MAKMHLYPESHDDLLHLTEVFGADFCSVSYFDLHVKVLLKLQKYYKKVLQKTKPDT